MIGHNSGTTGVELLWWFMLVHNWRLEVDCGKGGLHGERAKGQGADVQLQPVKTSCSVDRLDLLDLCGPSNQPRKYLGPSLFRLKRSHLCIVHNLPSVISLHNVGAPPYLSDPIRSTRNK
jgi:hypothetical protein